jgi:WD40 repeat protein
MRDGTLVTTLTGHTDSVTSVALSFDGQHIVSGSYDDSIKVWSMSDGALVRTLTGHTDSVYAVALSSDGQYIVSGSGDDSIKIWRMSDGALVRSMAVQVSVDFGQSRRVHR